MLSSEITHALSLHSLPVVFPHAVHALLLQTVRVLFLHIVRMLFRHAAQAPFTHDSMLFVHVSFLQTRSSDTLYTYSFYNYGRAVSTHCARAISIY